MNFREFATTRDRFLGRLSEIVLQIFKQVTTPYTHKPELIPIIAISRRDLEGALNGVKKGATQYAQ